MSRHGLARSFLKSGGEGYLLGLLEPSSGAVPEHERLHVIEVPTANTSGAAAGASSGGGGASIQFYRVWRPSAQPYTVTLGSPKKQSKMKGLKSFMSYQLTPSFSGIVVARRYKQFDWLLHRLEEKFTCVCIPPLPPKQVTGGLSFSTCLFFPLSSRTWPFFRKLYYCIYYPSYY